MGCRLNVELVSSWGEVDGLAEYAKQLVKSVPGVEFTIHGRPFATNDHFPGDIVHLNHEEHLMSVWTTAAAKQLKAWGKKTVVTYHNSHNCCRSAFTDVWDRVVIHEKIGNEFCYIPQGIPVWENTKGIEPQMKIGSAGFPVGHKGFVTMAQVAQDLGVGFLAICPASQWGDAVGTERAIHSICPQAEVVTDWLEAEQVIERLAECVATVYLHKGNNQGISASVRLGLATGRPTVITRERQFHDLWEGYEDELYVVDDTLPSIAQVRDMVAFALQDGKKKPKRILEDMNWNKCGQMYKDVYDELLA